MGPICFVEQIGNVEDVEVPVNDKTFKYDESRL